MRRMPLPPPPRPRRARAPPPDGPLAKARRRHPEAAAEGGREVRRVAVADQAGDVARPGSPLLSQQLGRRGHAPREQILAGS